MGHRRALERRALHIGGGQVDERQALDGRKRYQHAKGRQFRSHLPVVERGRFEVAILTLGVGLRYLVGTPESGIPTEHILMAGSVMMVTPIIIIFFLAQEYFVQGIATTGLKG